MNGNLFISFIERTGSSRIVFQKEGGWASKSTEYKIQIGVWTNIAVTYKNQEFNYYVDGSLKFTFKPDVPLPNLNIERTTNHIGFDTFNKKLNGVIDDLKLFDRALTMAEINFEKEKK